MKILVLLLMSLFALPVFACSCAHDERTLEERIDDAERVLRVRIVGSELEGEVASGTDLEERYRSERISYRLRSLETLKGDDSEPPRLVGLAGDGGGDCTVRLPVGAQMILFVERGEREISFNYCHMPFEGVDSVPDIDLRLRAVREFVDDRTPIHACENFRSIPADQKDECQERRRAAHTEWLEEYRRARGE